MDQAEPLLANPAVALREEPDGSGTLFHLGTGRSLGLNAVAVDVWKHIDGCRDADEVVRRVLAEYSDAPAEARFDLERCLANLSDAGFVAESPAEFFGEGAGSMDALPSLQSVDVDITARCNLRCLYCYHFDNPDMEYVDLPTSEWLAFFRELGRLGVQSVTLAGGEPFARADLAELVDGIVAAGLRFTILSNGGLLTDEMASHLRASGRCDAVQISVDGSRPETHDAARGEGSFEGAMHGLSLLREHGLSVTARVTVHHFNVDDLEATAALLLDKLGLPAIGTNAAGYLGSCRLHGEALQLSVAERERAMRTLTALAARYPGRIDASAGPLADARMWRLMEEARGTGAPRFELGGYLTACGCPWNRLAVLADGSIVVCNMLPHLVLGHVSVDDIGEVWRAHPVLWHHRLRSQTPLAGFAFCRSCPYTEYCTGNCPGPAYTLTGSADHPSPDSCLRDYLASGGSLVEGTVDG